MGSFPKPGLRPSFALQSGEHKRTRRSAGAAGGRASAALAAAAASLLCGGGREAGAVTSSDILGTKVWLDQHLFNMTL